MMHWLKKSVKTGFHLLGLDVRLRHRVRAHQQHLYQEQLRESWGFVRKYGIRTVLDIGANVGQFAKLIHSVLPDAAIYSFEPLASCYAELQKALENIPGAKCFNVALGNADGAAGMFHNDFSPSSSLLEMKDLHKEELPHTARANTEEIQIRRLDDILGGCRLQQGILVKMDVQGYTEAVILGGTETLSLARIAVVEASCYPLYEGEALFDGIYDLMRARGFVYVGNADQWRSRRDGRVLAVDAIFEKS